MLRQVAADLFELIAFEKAFSDVVLLIDAEGRSGGAGREVPAQDGLGTIVV